MAHSTRTLLLDGDWDITLTKAGNLALAEGDYATAQNVANECRLFTQDAFFAQDDGIPWYVAQLGKPLARSVASSRMRQAASDVSGVVSVESVTVEDIDPVTRIMDGTIRLTTTEEPVSQLTFDPKLGLVAPETESIREAVQSDWQGAFRDVDVELNVEPSTPAGQLVDAETAEIEAKNAELLFLSNMFNPKVSEGRWQDALGYIYFLTRKIAQPTVVECSVTGLMGTTIPYGAMAQSTDGYYLLNTGAFTIPESGTATGYFRLAEPGPIPIAAGSVTKIVTLIPGWSSIVNKSAGVVGRDVETRAEFESRRYASVAKNAHGTAPSLYGALADIDGVIDCRVLENITNVEVVKYGVTLEGHSVAACVYGGDDTAIAEVLFRKKDAGCGTSGNTEVTYEDTERSNAYGGPLYHYKIVRPSVETFWIQVNLVSKSLMAETTLEAVRQAVMDDFLGKSEASGNARVGLAQTVYASRFYTSVMAVEGITYLKNVKIRLGGSPETWLDVVDIDADVEPTLTLDNILVNVTES